VEQISIDEAFLDVTLMRDDATDIARALQMVINQQLHLPCSLGVAANKLVAKIANNIGKARAGIPGQPPNAITVVPPGEEAAFLAPLPVRELWGVGPKTAEALLRMGIKTIGELAARPESVLVERFGKHGQEMARRARGIDERPVTQEGEAKSISKETTFASDVRSAEPLRRALRELSDQVGRRLRHERLSGTTVRLKLRWADFTTLTRQTTLPEPTHHDDTIFDTGWALLNKVWAPGQPVRLIGIGVSGFEATERQMGLWDEAANTQTARLKATLDELKDRFGSKIVRRGSELGDSDA
jgi:DNA polymerase-4